MVVFGIQNSDFRHEFFVDVVCKMIVENPPIRIFPYLPELWNEQKCFFQPEIFWGEAQKIKKRLRTFPPKKHTQHYILVIFFPDARVVISFTSPSVFFFRKIFGPAGMAGFCDL